MPRAHVTRLFIVVLLLLSSASLSGCFKEWSVDEVKEWYVKQPQNWDEYMEFANREQGDGKIDKAAGHYQQALDTAEAQYGPNDLRVATSASQYAALEASRYKWSDAERLYRRALDVQMRKLGPNHTETIHTRRALAEALNQLFKPDEAKQVLGNLKPLDSRPPVTSKKTRRHHK